MKKSIMYLALALAIVAGLTVTETFARGGGGHGGGGSRGGYSGGERGGFNGGEREGGERERAERSNAGQRSNTPQRQQAQQHNQTNQNRAQNNAGNRTNNVQNRASQMQIRRSNAAAGRNFGSGFYGNHPGAWRATHPYAGAWAAVGLGTAAAWLGINGDDSAYVVDGTLTSDDSDDDGDDDDMDDEADEATVVDPQDAGANSNTVLPAANPNLLPLGVFAIKAENQTEPSAIVQLAVDKQGTLSGTYYDVVTDQGQPIQGTINKQDQTAAFTVGPNGSVVFNTTLKNLTQNSGKVAVQNSNGQSRDWSLTRLQEPKSTN